MKIRISLVLIPFLLHAWSFVADMRERVDLFVFIDYEQQLKWYVHYSAWYLALTVLAFNLWKSSDNRLQHAGQVLTWFGLISLICYWLFRWEPYTLGIDMGISFYMLLYFSDNRFNIFTSTKYIWRKFR